MSEREKEFFFHKTGHSLTLPSFPVERFPGKTLEALEQ